MVSGQYLSCIKRYMWRPSKILSLNFSMLSAGNFSHKYAKQSLSLFKVFTNFSHTLIWRGGNSTLFWLIKGKYIIFLSSISNPSLFGQRSLVQCSWQALLSHRHKKHGNFVYSLCCPTKMHKFFKFTANHPVMFISYGTRHRLFWQDFNVVTAYQQATTNTVSVGLVVQQQLMKYFSI